MTIFEETVEEVQGARNSPRLAEEKTFCQRSCGEGDHDHDAMVEEVSAQLDAESTKRDDEPGSSE